MNCFRGCLAVSFALVWAATTFLTGSALAQDIASGSAGKSEQWIHVRVESKEDHGETVRVNVPIEMAAKVLPAIHDKNLHDGKVRIDCDKMNKDVDLRALLEAVESSRDGEYVTVQSNENNVRVAKSSGYLYVHVTDKDGKKAGQGGPTTVVGVTREPTRTYDSALGSGAA